MKISVYTDKILPKSGGAYSFTDGVIKQLSDTLGEGLLIHRVSEKGWFWELFEKAGRKVFSKNLKFLNKIGFMSFFDGTDFVYFPSLHFEPVPKRYVFTVWDLCHLNHPNSPDITNGFNYEKREQLYIYPLSRAHKIITGTEFTKRLIIDHYKVPANKVMVIPLPARNIFFDMERFSISPLNKKYIFYPAQFWHHKNHKVIVDAVKILKDRYELIINVVFCGSDAGQLSNIKSMVTKVGLEKEFFFAGFISDEELVQYYDHAEALVFPSLFGPDNIPPLEAMARSCPVLYADIEGAREFYGDSVELFNPNDTEELAKMLFDILGNKEKKQSLIENGRKFVNDKNYRNYVHSLLEKVFIRK